MRRKVAITLGCAGLIAATLLFAQAVQMVRVNVPFQFLIEGKTLPAGEYDFTRTDNDQAIRITPVKKGSAIEAPVITRLGGAIHTSPKDSHIVFDKVGDLYYLSELWFPGSDGYLLHTTKEKHEHRTLNAPS